jgi:hypothetical protein
MRSAASRPRTAWENPVSNAGITRLTGGRFVLARWRALFCCVMR